MRSNNLRYRASIHFHQDRVCLLYLLKVCFGFRNSGVHLKTSVKGLSIFTSSKSLQTEGG